MLPFLVNKIPALADMAAFNAAKLLSFDAIEQIYHHLKPGSRIPDDILKPILKRCFPRCPEDIRTYSFIANGSPVQFNDGMQLYENGAVQNVIQIGKCFRSNVRNCFLKVYSMFCTKMLFHPNSKTKFYSQF